MYLVSHEAKLHGVADNEVTICMIFVPILLKCGTRSPAGKADAKPHRYTDGQGTKKADKPKMICPQNI